MFFLFIRIFLTVTLLTFCLPSFATFSKLLNFGDNPGELSASYYQSGERTKGALVVLLHGCGQQGEKFAEQSGFLAQAQHHGFSLLIPQQNSKNHGKLCFNWYSAEDYQKDLGENLSLKNMILAMKKITGTEKVYIAGLSAGGAMTSSLLINYPELFTGGAIIAGLPYACAEDLTQAMACMKEGPKQTLLAQKKINATKTAWPKLTVWSGKQDRIVNPYNAKILAQQWVTLTSVSEEHAQPRKSAIKDNISIDTQSASGVTVSNWYDSDNTLQVQLVEIDNIGHGMPVMSNESAAGTKGAYLLDAPLSAALMIPKFWQLY
jgi:poly(hydroxyalkanoate) depolymerase family esterase